MADDFRYFSPESEVLRSPYPIDNAQFSARFPGVRGKRYDSFSRWVGRDNNGDLQPVVRVIRYKANPSLHKCDGRCLHAKGGNCECSCGGKNHGAGNS